MAPRIVIWFAIVFSTVIYLGMLLFMFREPVGDFEALTERTIVRVLYGLALTTFLVAWFVVPRFVTSNARAKMITTLAVFEACAIFGLLAAFLTRDWRLYLAPWALALLGFIREFPRGEIGEGRAPM